MARRVFLAATKGDANSIPVLSLANWLSDLGIFDPPVVFGALLFFTRVGFSAGVGLPTSCNHFERWSSAETCH